MASPAPKSALHTDRPIYYNKRVLLSESFDKFNPGDRDSDSDTEVASSLWLNTDAKHDIIHHINHSESDISMDDNLSFISKNLDNKPYNAGGRSKTYGNYNMMHDDSLSQLISTSMLDELRADGLSMDEEDKLVQEEWKKQVNLQKMKQVDIRATFQEPVKKKLEISSTPRYTEHDVYYIFQYHYIEHAIDWLFLPEEPYILIELLSDQQAIYANQTLTIITDRMPEYEIMPCYFAFKGMISLFVSQFDKAFDYFTKAYQREENLLFMFWKAVSKFYVWMQTKDYEDFALLKILVSKFENLSQFNVNIKWIRLKIRLYEYKNIDNTPFSLNKAKDSASEIKSINPYLGYIAWAEIYASNNDFEKSIEILKDCIDLEPNRVHAYIRLYYYIQKVETPVYIFEIFLKQYLFIRDTRDYIEKHSEIRYRLMTLLFIRVAALEGRITPAINTICKLYKEDGDKLSILMEFARVVTKFGCTEYVGEAMGVLEEIELRGCVERNRDVYFLMAQIEILRGNIMIGYKLFMEALNHLHSQQDERRIEYIESFIVAYKPNVLKAIEFEKIIEEKRTLSDKAFKKAINDLSLIETVDKKYADMIKLKLYSLKIQNPYESLEMIAQVYSYRPSDIKLAIYYFDYAFTHKDVVRMVELRKIVLDLVENNEIISTNEYVTALDLVYRTYAFQGKYSKAISILDRINEWVPTLPDDYDLNRVRMLIHCNRDETSEDTREYNIRVGPVPLLDFSQIEKLNITKLIMKDTNSQRHDKSMLSDKSLERRSKTTRESIVQQKERSSKDSTNSYDLFEQDSLGNVKLVEDPLPIESSDSPSQQTSEELELHDEKTITFRSYSDPRYYYEKGKLCIRIVLDYHAKVADDSNEEENKYPDLISFEDNEDNLAIQQLASRDYNELLEEGLASLVEYLLNLFYRKQYYTDQDFSKMKEKAFFWVSVTLFKLKRYEESLDLIQRYSNFWRHSEKFLNKIISEMFIAYPSLKEKYGHKLS